MSTLILSSITNIISSAIGKRVGNSIEAILKNSLGKDLDAALLHKNKPHLAKDMRLQDIKVQTSTYGKMIPDVYGTVRISGNIIWAQQIKYTQHREVDITDTTSRNTQTINNYHATLAIALCSGPVHRVSKVWANGKPVDLDTLKYRLYKGTEEQEPDPLICSIEGSAPAYLGLSYIVIENFPLRDYNNAIPNFVFEVTSYPDTS